MACDNCVPFWLVVVTVSVRLLSALTTVSSVVIVSKTGALAEPAPVELAEVVFNRPVASTVETLSSRSEPLAFTSVCVVVVEPLALVTVCCFVVSSSVTPSVRSLVIVRVAEFAAVWVTVVTRLVTVVPAESVTVSVRCVGELITVASTEIVESAARPSTRLVTVRVRPLADTVVVVTLLALPLGLRSETTIELEPSALVVSTSSCVVQPPPNWSLRIVTTRPLALMVVVVELSFSEPVVPEAVSSPFAWIAPPA